MRGVHERLPSRNPTWQRSTINGGFPIEVGIPKLEDRLQKRSSDHPWESVTGVSSNLREKAQNLWIPVSRGFPEIVSATSHSRRKFWSQTSDNLQRWKSRGGKSQGGEVKKWEEQRRERVGSKKMHVREKVGKSRFTVFFHWFVAPEVRKVTSLKRRVRNQLARWEMKNCTPLWREAHL